MNASNWTILSIAFLIGGGVFLALHSLRRRLSRTRAAEDTGGHKPPNHYDAALQALSVLGVDPEAKDNDGGTPMHRAAGEGRVQIIELLYAAGANPNARDNRGRAPLHRAAYQGRTEAIDALVAGGADLNARDNNNDTPLHDATRAECSNAIEALGSAGAELQRKGRVRLQPSAQCCLLGAHRSPRSPSRRGCRRQRARRQGPHTSAPRWGPRGSP